MLPGDIRTYFEDRQDDFPSYPSDGRGIRCAATLTDGTILDCVILRERTPRLDLCLSRLQEVRAGRHRADRKVDPERALLEAFIATGNQINFYDIAELSQSRCALPANLLRDIHGETLMSWTGWVFEMMDGSLHSFATTFLFEFFNIPEGFDFDSVRRVHNHSYVDDHGQITPIREKAENIMSAERYLKWHEENADQTTRERPFFTCYLPAPGAYL